MAFKAASMALCVLHLAAALPTDLLKPPSVETLHTIEAMEEVDDTVSVGSYIRETRAAPPEGEYYKSDEREGNGEIGYSRKKSGGGKKGYQHFDSYHKKAGDNYEFEKQDSFGHDEEGQDAAHSHRNERRAKKDDERDDDRYEEPLHENERLREAEEIEDEANEEEEPRKKKQRQEKGHAELKEGAEDGNGGVEAYGHDPKDYVLPEKYVYGNDAEEYNF